MPFARRLAAAALAGVLALPAPALAQTAGRSPGAPATIDQPFAPGVAYDPAIPTLRSVLGYDTGERITRPADLRRYFDALAAAAPDRVVVGEQAETWEGRKVFWAAVGSPANIARLDRIKANSRALADPRVTSPARARAIMADQPVIVWMAYSVHGNEISPGDAAAAAAHHLLAARDPAVQAWLANTVVVFVPSQNPDGRDRFISGYDAAHGLAVDPDPLSAERAEPWPSGRYNHYLFDLNRDWFIQTQPETRGHARQIRDWRPQVVVDSHEMGTDETFFFPPEAEPLNPWLTEATLESRAIFGRNTAARFDQAGIEYFNREIFDAFYPGYGDGWPAYFGAVSMTYEQGSARGLAARRSSGEVITYRDTVRNHFIATLATIETASREHDRLLTNFYDYGAEGLASGRGQGAWVLSRSGDPAAADRLAALLVRSGIEVGRAQGGFSACGSSHAAGDYIVSLAQPQSRMANVLLERDVPLRPGFLAEQEARRARGLDHEIYDVTAWSLPLMFNVPAAKCRGVPAVAVSPVSDDLTPPGRVVGAGADAVAWLVPPGVAGARFMAAALAEDVRLRSMEEGFEKDGRAWPAGTLVVPMTGNAPDTPARVAALAASTGALVTGVTETWVDSGPSLGSDQATLLRAPRIALAWDGPTDPPAAGAVRYIIEREFGYPVTAVRTARLASADLSRFQVIILPDGGDYESELGDGGVANLREWARRGGTLIGISGGARLLAAPKSQMLDSRRESEPVPESDDEPAAEPGEDAVVDGRLIDDADAYAALVRPEDKTPDTVAGALLRARVDTEHWLGAGLPQTLNVMVRGSDVYTPLRRDQGTNVVRLEGPGDLVASGQIWEENRALLAYKPIAMSADFGRGQLVAFTQDITERGYLEALKPLLLNAVFKGPAHSSPNWGE